MIQAQTEKRIHFPTRVRGQISELCRNLLWRMLEVRTRRAAKGTSQEVVLKDNYRIDNVHVHIFVRAGGRNEASDSRSMFAVRVVDHHGRRNHDRLPLLLWRLNRRQRESLSLDPPDQTLLRGPGIFFFMFVSLIWQRG